MGVGVSVESLFPLSMAFAEFLYFFNGGHYVKASFREKIYFYPGSFLI